MEILIIIGLVLLNGVFSMSEMSLVASRKFKLEQEKKKGKSGAKTALELSENPTKFLSTVQIGITLIGILLGVYSGENLTNDMVNLLNHVAFLQPYSKNLASFIIVVLVTYISIVFGELLPKRIGMAFPEPIAIVLSKPMQILSKITSPFVWLLTATNNLALTIMGIKNQSDTSVSEEEIKSIIKESAQGGEIQDIEQDIVERVFELGDRKVNTLYTHRKDIVYFNLNDSWEVIKDKINTEKHSAYPVCNSENLDDILGIVLVKDLFSPFTNNDFKLKDVVKKPIFINENTYAYKVLETFKKEKLHYGLVVDEFGTIAGIVTMDDVVDALIGDVTENDQDEYQLKQRNENSWLADGQFSLIDFVKYFQLSVDEEIMDKYTTISGLIIHNHTTIPDVGMKITVENLELEVIDKDGQRIDKILITKIIE